MFLMLLSGRCMRYVQRSLHDDLSYSLRGVANATRDPHTRAALEALADDWSARLAQNCF